MILNDWDVWYSLSTSFPDLSLTPSQIGQRLVGSGFARFAATRDGQCWYAGDEGAEHGQLKVSLNPVGDRARFQFSPSLPGGFGSEAAWQSVLFRFAEKRLFGEGQPLPPDYVRAYLGLVTLKSGGWTVRTYPVLTIFEPGIALLELRVIAPPESVEEEEFVRYVVNLYSHPIDDILVAPGIMAGIIRSVWFDKPFAFRLSVSKLYTKADLLAKAYSETHDEGDFQFDLVGRNDLFHLEGEEELQDLFESLTITDIARHLLSAAGSAMSDHRSRLGYLIRGDKNPYEPGGWWTMRPHVHLLRFEDQAETASENETRHRDALKRIFARFSDPDIQPRKDWLPENLRPWDDYAAYIGSHLTLWVWALSGIERLVESADRNRGHLIYENQVKAQTLEFGYMLHRAMEEEAQSEERLARIIELKRSLIQLEIAMEAISGFRELLELFTISWQRMGIPRMRRRTRDLLDMQEAAATSRESRRLEQWGLLLTVVLTLSVAPDFAERLAKPVWLFLNLRRPISDSVFDLILLGVSTAFMGVLILALWLLLIRRTGRAYTETR